MKKIAFAGAVLLSTTLAVSACSESSVQVVDTPPSTEAGEPDESAVEVEQDPVAAIIAREIDVPDEMQAAFDVSVGDVFEVPYPVNGERFILTYLELDGSAAAEAIVQPATLGDAPGQDQQDTEPNNEGISFEAISAGEGLLVVQSTSGDEFYEVTVS